MPTCSTSTAVLALAIILLLARPTHAFGAGNIASTARIEGSNWRHGDIEDTLLTLIMSRAAGGKKFDKMQVARVYFGNWLRDYSQAVDVGTVKYVSAEAIRILLWVLGFMTFGYGTREFEVTSERLGCYRPEDHIDNPKDYADNIDARQYDRRLRGPVNERIELAIDPRTGLKNYIANEQAGVMTSALHVRRLFGECIRLGRSYARSKSKDELYEALRLLGTGLHCLEDFSAHSNYTELALIEMGERNVFPHVGRRTEIKLQGVQHQVYPIITGTFGGVDFLHSVMGEFSDKATQSEIQELEGTIQNSSNSDNSMLKDLLNKIPSGLFGGKDEAKKADELQANATAAQMSQMQVSPRQPEQFTRQMQQVSKQIYPIIEWHDDLMKSITAAIEKIPVLPDLIEQLEEQLNVYVFSLLAPFVLPIITQIKNELNTGSSEIIQSSKDKQLIVFNDDSSTDPTHSMLSKDHFSNILNEPAGKIASAVVKWVVPQLISCWDDERTDADRTINRIIAGVFHHPAQRNQGQDGAMDGRMIMFNVVEQWWRSNNEQDEYRRKLCRDGVYRGDNHKEGVHDTGHGCGKPLGMHKNAPNITSGMGGAGFAGAGAGALVGGLSSVLGAASGGKSESADSNPISGLVGALTGGIGGSLLSGLGKSSKHDHGSSSYQHEGYTSSGAYKQEYTELENRGNRYQQTQYEETTYPSGERTKEVRRYEQSGNQNVGGFGYEERVDERPTYGGGYERTEERIYEGGGSNNWRDERSEYIPPQRDTQGLGSYGARGSHEQGYGQSDEGYGGEGRFREQESSGGGYEQPRERYGGQESSGGGYGRQNEGRREESEAPRQEYGGGGGFGGGGGYGGDEGGWREGERGGDRGDEYQEERDEGYGDQEYREEEREEGGGGGWFS